MPEEKEQTPTEDTAKSESPKTLDDPTRIRKMLDPLWPNPILKGPEPKNKPRRK